MVLAAALAGCAQPAPHEAPAFSFEAVRLLMGDKGPTLAVSFEAEVLGHIYVQDEEGARIGAAPWEATTQRKVSVPLALERARALAAEPLVLHIFASAGSRVLAERVETFHPGRLALAGPPSLVTAEGEAHAVRLRLSNAGDLPVELIQAELKGPGWTLSFHDALHVVIDGGDERDVLLDDCGSFYGCRGPLKADAAYHLALKDSTGRTTDATITGEHRGPLPQLMRAEEILDEGRLMGINVSLTNGGDLPLRLTSATISLGDASHRAEGAMPTLHAGGTATFTVHPLAWSGAPTALLPPPGASQARLELAFDAAPNLTWTGPTHAVALALEASPEAWDLYGLSGINLRARASGDLPVHVGAVTWTLGNGTAAHRPATSHRVGTDAIELHVAQNTFADVKPRNASPQDLVVHVYDAAGREIARLSRSLPAPRVAIGLVEPSVACYSHRTTCDVGRVTLVATGSSPTPAYAAAVRTTLAGQTATGQVFTGGPILEGKDFSFTDWSGLRNIPRGTHLLRVELLALDGTSIASHESEIHLA